MVAPMVQASSLTLVVVVENGELAPDVVARIVDDEEDIALTPAHPTGWDADGRMLFLAPDADKALQLVRRYRFQAARGAGFTFTLAMRIVLPDGTDAASRDKVLGHVVTHLAHKDFAVEVSSATDDVFILSAESAPRIEKLLRPAFPHRIKGVDVKFEPALVRVRADSANAKADSANVPSATTPMVASLSRQVSYAFKQQMKDLMMRNEAMMLARDDKEEIDAVRMISSILSHNGLDMELTRELTSLMSDVYSADPNARTLIQNAGGAKRWFEKHPSTFQLFRPQPNEQPQKWSVRLSPIHKNSILLRAPPLPQQQPFRLTPFSSPQPPPLSQAPPLPPNPPPPPPRTPPLPPTPPPATSLVAPLQQAATHAWSEHLTPEGLRYCYNTATGTSSWERPHELSQQGQRGQPGVPPLPPIPIYPRASTYDVNRARYQPPQGMPPHMSAASLAAAPPEQQKQLLGERLYPLISQVQPSNAGKITGMLLEMDNGELLNLLESPEALNAKIVEAVSVLDMHAAEGDVKTEATSRGAFAATRATEEIPGATEEIPGAAEEIPASGGDSARSNPSPFMSGKPVDGFPDWASYPSPDGRTYYYNAKTGTSSWERPHELSQQGQRGQPGVPPLPPMPQALPPPPACANPRRDASADEDPRPEVVHIYGFDTRMKAEDLLSLFKAKGLAPPRTVAWVNDSSANVVFSDASAARAALEQRTVPLLPNAQDIDTTSWRTLPIELAAAGKGLQLLFRLATASDFQPKQQDKPCKPWQKGRCLYGSACKFAHDARKPPPLQKQRSASFDSPFGRASITETVLGGLKVGKCKRFM